MAGTDVQHPVYILAQPAVQIKRFSGNKEEVDEFAANIQLAWESQPTLSSTRMLEMIKRNVSLEVRQEIACMAETTIADPLKVLETLVQIFGERRTPSALLQEFLTLSQRPEESVRKFSGRLKASFDILVKRQRVLSPDDLTPASLLRDHFVENLNSGLLRSYLRERMHESDLKFSDVRQIAVRWESEDELVVNQIQTPTSISQPSLDTTPLPHSPVVPTPCPSTDLVTAALSELTKKVVQLACQMQESYVDPKDRPQVL